jgi:hypothetical protein
MFLSSFESRLGPQYTRNDLLRQKNAHGHAAPVRKKALTGTAAAN